MLMLAIGSFLFGLLLVAFKHNKNNPQKVPYWILAKILQGIGFLLLYLRTDRFDFLTVPANLSLLAGCAYEAWAVRILLGQSIKRKVHLATLIVIIFACNLAYFLVAP